MTPSTTLHLTSSATIDPALTDSGRSLSGIDGLIAVDIRHQAAGGVTVGDGPYRIEIAPTGVAPSASSAHLVNGTAAHFSDTAADTDTVVRPTAAGVEIFQTLESPAAPDQLSWTLNLQPGQRLVSLSSGGIAIVAGTGAQGDNAVAQTAVPVAAPTPRVPASPKVSAKVQATEDGAIASARAAANRTSTRSTTPPGSQEPGGAPLAEVNNTAAQLHAAQRDINAAQVTIGSDWVVGAISAPWATDAAGNRVPTSVSANGAVLTLTIGVNSSSSFPIIAGRSINSSCAITHSPNSAPANWERGMNTVTWWHDGYNKIDKPHYDALDAEYCQGGIKEVVLTPTNYAHSDTPGSRSPSSINLNWNDGYGVKNESDASVRYAACAAEKGRRGGYAGGPGGMSIALKPQIDPEGFAYYRGYIDPQGAHLRSFWRDYTHLMTHYARLAIQTRAKFLVVGTELTALTSRTDGNGNPIYDSSGQAIPQASDTARWGRLIAAIENQSSHRYTCPGTGGTSRPTDALYRFSHENIKVIFAANWDAVTGVGFWNDPNVDYVGVDWYWDGQSLAACYTAVDKVEDGLIADPKVGTSKPFIYTEVGYNGFADLAGFHRSQPNPSDPADDNRAAAFGAMLRYWKHAYSHHDAPWFRGFWWWDKYANGGDGSSSSYPVLYDSGGTTPGLTATKVLCLWQCRAR